MARERVRGHVKADGTKVPTYTRRKRKGAAAVTATVVLTSPFTAPSLFRTGKPPARAPKVEQVKDRVGRAEVRLARKGYKVNGRTQVETDCVAHSYDDVSAFFRRHPCAYVVRTYFELKDPKRRVVIIAVSHVAMPDAADAAAYKRLVDVQGTGNVTELTKDVGAYKRKAKYDGGGYRSGMDGTVVWNAQATAVGWSLSTVLLNVLIDGVF